VFILPYPIQRSVRPLFIVLGVIVAAIILLTASGVYTIQSGFVGILSTFGEYAKEPKDPGLHFKIPIVQEVKYIDVKLQTANYQGNKIREHDGVIYQPRIVVLDSKNLNIGIDLTVQFEPHASEGKSILANYGVNYFTKLIDPIIRDTVRDVVSNFQAEDIARQRSHIADALNQAMRQNFKGLPFKLVAVQLRDIDLPKIVREKIEEVQLAKQEEQRLMMIEKQAEKQQHIKTIEANTLMIEIVTKAKADAQEKRLEAEAEAFQIKVQSEAQAEANKLILNSLDDKGLVIQYKAVQKWDGSYPQTLVGDKTGIILQLPEGVKN